MKLITLKNGTVVKEFESNFIDTTIGVEYYFAMDDIDSLTLYPTGEVNGESLLVYQSNGEIDADSTIDKLMSMGIGPFRLSMKKFLKVMNFKKGDVSKYGFTLACEDNCKCRIDETKTKPDVVRVVRYLRNRYPDGEIYNMTGMTLVAYLNYPEEEVTLYWSDCNGDNFSKDDGVAHALTDNHQLTFPMFEGGIPQCGLVKYIASMTYDLINVHGCKDAKLNKFYNRLDRYITMVDKV